jgi:hypothetical protein
MSKNEELQKHTLNLHRGDYEKLQSMFPDLGAGPVIRQIVRNFIERAEAETQTTRPQISI